MPTSKKIRYSSFFLITAWSVFIIYFWIRNHSYLYFSYDGKFSSQTALLPATLFVTISIALYLIIRIFNKKFDFRYYGPELLVFFIILTTLIFNIAASSIQIGEHLEPEKIIPTDKLLMANLYFLGKLALQISWMFCFLLTAYSLGKIVLTFFRNEDLTKKDNPLFDLIIKVGIGIFGFSLIIFILGLLGIIKLEIILFIAAIIIAIDHKTLGAIFSYLRKEKPLKIPSDFKVILLSTFFLLILSILIINSMRPFPLGYDDSTFYLNKARIMAESETIAWGSNPFPFSLIETIGYTISKSASFAIAINVIYFLLCTISTYGFLKQVLKSKSAGILGAYIFAFLPMGWHLMLNEVKSDLLLYLICAMSLWSLVLWIDTHQKKFLFLTVFFLGFATTIKLTGFFLAIGIFIVIFYKLRAIGTTWLKTAILSMITFLLPWLPWLLIISFQRISFPIEENASLLNILSTRSANEISLATDWERVTNQNFYSCTGTFEMEDKQRFSEDKEGAVLNPIFLPWNLTINSGKNGMLSEIGFLFIIASIPALLFFVNNRHSPKKESNLLKIAAFIATAYWLTWIILAKKMLWYGFPGMLFFILFSVYAFKKTKDNLFKYFLFFIVLLYSLANLSILYWSNKSLITYLSGIDNMEIAQKNIITMVEPINKNIHGRSLVTTGTFPYYIQSDKDYLFDSYLDKFSCIDREKNDEITLQRLRDLDFKYALINKSLSKIEANENGTAHKKLSRAIEFFSKNSRIILEKDAILLFEL